MHLRTTGPLTVYRCSPSITESMIWRAGAARSPVDLASEALCFHIVLHPPGGHCEAFRGALPPGGRQALAVLGRPPPVAVTAPDSVPLPFLRAFSFGFARSHQDCAPALTPVVRRGSAFGTHVLAPCSVAVRRRHRALFTPAGGTVPESGAHLPTRRSRRRTACAAVTRSTLTATPVHGDRAVVPANHLQRVVECVCHGVDHGPVQLDDDTRSSRQGALPPSWSPPNAPAPPICSSTSSLPPVQRPECGADARTRPCRWEPQRRRTR